jgi:hypothetical protein
MTGRIRDAGAFLALLSVTILPVAPRAHVPRSQTQDGHARVIVHRHFAPHTSPAGTHVERPGMADGAPTWIDDPTGPLPDQLVVEPDTTSTRAEALRPPPDCVTAIPSLAGVSLHSPPRSPAGLRAPPDRT